MAHTLSTPKIGTLGDRRTSRATVTLSTYATGGESITAAELGLVYIEELIPHPVNAAGISPAWNLVPGTSTLVLLYDEDNASGVEAEAAAAANTSVIAILAIGF